MMLHRMDSPARLTFHQMNAEDECHLRDLFDMKQVGPTLPICPNCDASFCNAWMMLKIMHSRPTSDSWRAAICSCQAICDCSPLFVTDIMISGARLRMKVIHGKRNAQSTCLEVAAPPQQELLSYPSQGNDELLIVE